MVFLADHPCAPVDLCNRLKRPNPLRIFNLKWCGRGMNDNVVKDLIATKPSNLKDLSLHGCFQMSNQVMIDFFLACTSLERLELSGNTRFDSSLLTSINENAQHRMLSLSLADCDSINDAAGTIPTLL